MHRPCRQRCIASRAARITTIEWLVVVHASRLMMVPLMMLVLVAVLSMGRVVDWWRGRRTVHLWRCLGMRIVRMISRPSTNMMSFPVSMVHDFLLLHKGVIH